MIDSQNAPINGAATEELIQQAIQMLFVPGSPVEIRGKKLDKSIRSKFYSDHSKIARALANANKGEEFEALWYTLQRLNPDIDPQSKSETGKATDRGDILSYEWLVIDVDRKDQAFKKLNATDGELQELRSAALRVIGWLRSKGFPEPVLACSGNGWHILYKVNHLLPTEHPLLEDVLRAVWHQFLAEPVCVIDTSLAEPEQVIKAYGTESRKTPAGHPDIDIRPWRKSYLETVPSIIAPVSHSTLESVAALAPLESRTNHKGGSGLPLHPDFDETEWWEHYEDAFVPLTTEGGQAVIHNGYQVTNICPFTYRGEGTGHRHTGSTFTGVKFNEGQPECHCFSDDHCDLSFGDLTRHLNQYHEPYPGPIWDHSEEDDQSDFAEPVGIEDVVPQPPPIKPNGHDTKPCPFGVHKAGECMCTLSKEEVTESARKVKQENERRKPERDAHKARMTETRSDIREGEKSEEAPEECECPDIEARVNKRLAFGPMPEACLYGYLGELARKLECPLGYAYPTVLAVYASRWIGIATRTIRQNLFVVLMGDTSTGKTRTMNRSMSAVGCEGIPRIIDNAIGSGEGLVEKLGGKKDNQLQPLDRIGLPLLLHQDEMRELMAKMAIDNSSIPYKLNRLWERDDIGTQAKKSILTAYANASFLGGLTVESPAEFAALFGKGTVTGLYVRCIYGWAPEGWRFDDMWEELEKVSPEPRPPNKNVRVPKEIFAMKNAWEMIDPKSRGQRLSQNALRIALVTAAANGDAEITSEGMRAALLFCEWQEALRSVYKPSRAESPGGKLSEAIMEEAWRHVDEEGNFAWFTWREAYRHNHWERQDGVALNKQRDHLRKNGLLETEKLEEGSKKTPRIKASTWSK